MGILRKTIYFDQKWKFLPKMEIFTKNGNVYQKWKFLTKM